MYKGALYLYLPWLTDTNPTLIQHPTEGVKAYKAAIQLTSFRGLGAANDA
jgi:hypothetical protein